MIKFNPVTPMLFLVKSSTYVPGQGQITEWAKVIPYPLYGEWKSGYGDRALAAEAVGVTDMATCRVYYYPAVYQAMQKSQVLVVRNADAEALIEGVPNKESINLYELWGGVDNVAQENLFMEFRVRRYEGK